MIRSVDKDVVIIAISIIPTLNATELWVAFGTGRHLSYIPTHMIALSLGLVKSKVLPMFHAYTGCDTVSFFANKGKKTAWDVWKTYDKLTEAFYSVVVAPDDLKDETISTIERFTVQLYKRISTLSSDDTARMELFVKNGRGMEDITLNKRCTYASYPWKYIPSCIYCWGKTLELSPDFPCPSDWGWSNPEEWQSIWTTLPQASQATRELLRSGCQKGCRNACRDLKAALHCTELCHCGGDCAD